MMIHVLGRVTVKDVPHFISIFATRGAEVRRYHGSSEAQLFRVIGQPQEGAHQPDDMQHVVVLFAWESREAFQGFLDDPNVRETMKVAGITEPPEFTILEEVGLFPA